MTRNQIIKKLVEAKVEMTTVTVRKGEIEIYATTKAGEFSDRKTRIEMNKAARVLGWGGYRCGYGAWVLQERHVDMGDWNDKSSRWHY